MNLSELLRHVEEKTGASICLNMDNEIFFHNKRLELAPDQNLHHSDYCRFCKFHGANTTCRQNKGRSHVIAKLGRSFSGCCPHGIWEFVQPVVFNGELCATIYFGNFRSTKPLNPPGNAVWTGRMPEIITDERKKLIRKYSAFLLEFITADFELYGAYDRNISRKYHGESYYVECCRRFIDQYYLKNIALSDLADLLKVNANYLGAMLKQEMKKTFREMLTERRLKEARTYLRFHKDMSVTEIALLCGFSDGNYFSSIFHKAFGITPSEYRKSGKN